MKFYRMNIDEYVHVVRECALGLYMQIMKINECFHYKKAVLTNKAHVLV